MKRIALVLPVIMLLVASSVLAQGNTLGLSAPDALLLAAANSAPLDSFAFEYDLRYEVNLDTFHAAANLRGSGAVDREAPAMSASLSGELKIGATQFIPLDEVRWVDDTLYLETGEGWQALEDAPTAISDLIGEFTGLSVDTEALSVWNLMGVDGLDDFLTTIASADTSTFVMAQRLDDEGDTAHFRLTADLHALFDSDAFVDAIVALSQAQGSDLIVRTRDEVAEMLRANNQAVDPATLTIDEFIGLDDGLIHLFSVNLNMEIAPEIAGYIDAPFMVYLGFSLGLHEHNQPQSIAAPDDAVVVSAFALSIPAPEPPGDGVTQYMFFRTLAENAAESFPFEAQVGDTVTITARRLSLEFDPLITLLSPVGEALADNDDHELPVFATADYDAQIADFTIPESGTYSIEVADSYGGAGSYVLTINIRR